MKKLNKTLDKHNLHPNTVERILDGKYVPGIREDVVNKIKKLVQLLSGGVRY